MTISKATSHFLDHCRSALSLSPHTLRAYMSDLNDVRDYFGPQRRLAAITRDGLRDYIRYLREKRFFKESSIKRRLATLKLLFRRSLIEGTLTCNPFDTLDARIRLPKKLPRALDRSHAQQLRRAITPAARRDSFDDHANKIAILLLMETGIRVGELASIRLEDLSLPDRHLKIHGKGNRQRLVYILSQPLYRSLDSYLAKRVKLTAQSKQLFVTSTGLDITPQRLRSSLHELAARSGIERRVTPHMLRHTCATQWLEAGLDIRYVQKLLGHQSISTTEIYTHVSDQALREALLRAQGGKMR